jgi:hypothetical protein
MLYREIIAVCSQINKKHINALGGRNVELLNYTVGITNFWINLMMTSSETAIFSRMEPHASPRMRA